LPTGQFGGRRKVMASKKKPAKKLKKAKALQHTKPLSYSPFVKVSKN
jgi:hypothetical protein